MIKYQTNKQKAVSSHNESSDDVEKTLYNRIEQKTTQLFGKYQKSNLWES